MNRSDIQQILDTDYAIPADHALADSTSQLETLLSSPDSFLRENATEILWQWTLRGFFTDEQLIALGNRMANCLGRGAGETETDSVFLRAFAALALAGVLIADQRAVEGQFHERDPFLTQDQVIAWFDATLACFEAEQDRRGHVEQKGWAHALAHEADVLSDFARSHNIQKPQLERLLDAVATKMIEPCDRVLKFNEDERIIQAVMDILRRNLVGIEFLQQWLDRIAHTSDGGHWADVFGLASCSEADNNARINARLFLRSLYFQLQFGSRSFRAQYLPDHYAREILVRDELIAAVLDAIKHTDKYFYAREDGS